MFALHTANRTELLFEQLVTVLGAYDYGPFDPVHFLVQGRGMERWLQLQLARRRGVFSLARFDFPNRFFAALAAALGLRLNDTAFERHRLVWLLDALLAEPDFQQDPALRRYLQGPAPTLRRFQFARQLAQLFDQYQIQRRDWLAAWQRGNTVPQKGLDQDTERWQAELWRRLYRRLGGHRGELWEELVRRLRGGDPGIALPQAVHAFGIGFLPPLMLEVLAALARHTDIHLFLLTPVAGYWADLPGKRRRARALLQEGPEVEWVGMYHPLLAALGQRGAQFQRLVLECLEPALESECFARHDPPGSLLQHLQNDLAANTLSSPSAGIEVGIELHRCHTPLREVEVARDRILAALAEDPSLRLEDIAVMAPEIGAYQPYLEAVFADLPHRIADRTLGRRNGLLEVLISALELLAGRFEWEGVLELLGRAPVRERFGLSATQLPVLERWVKDCAIRWGLDSVQRQSIGLPPSEHNTWRLGVDRMLLGWMTAGDGPWRGVAPFAEVEGQAGTALLRLAAFLRTLQIWWRRWRNPLSLAEWGATLRRFTADLFAFTPETADARQVLEELLEALPGPADYGAEVDLAVIIDWLRSRVEEEISDEFLSGGITCCTLLPMRAVPFRHIVVLGLNDGAFPSRETAPAFDLIAAHPRLGDRDKRLEQRHQFLEVLLSVRDRLILICQGLTPEKNEDRPPAQVVDELTDTLDRYGIERRRWVYPHPSHPFHPSYFLADARFPGRDPARFPVAQALLGDGRKTRCWPEGFHLQDNPPGVIDLADLVHFCGDAQRWFLTQRLQMEQGEQETLPPAREPFQVDNLGLWRMRCRLLDELQSQGDPHALLQQAQRSGEWPQGEAGRQAFESALAQVRQLLAAAVRCQAGGLQPPRLAEVAVAGTFLRGRIEHRGDDGTLIVIPARVQGKHLFRAWIRHGFNQAAGAAPTWLVALAKGKAGDEVVTLRFDPPTGDHPLAVWVSHYLAHWNRPSLWLADWGFCWWQCHPDTEKWAERVLETEPPEAFSLLFGEVEADLPRRVLPLYHRLLRDFAVIPVEE